MSKFYEAWIIDRLQNSIYYELTIKSENIIVAQHEIINNVANMLAKHQGTRISNLEIFHLAERKEEELEGLVLDDFRENIGILREVKIIGKLGE